MLNLIPLSETNLSEFCSLSTSVFSDYIAGAHIMSLTEAQHMMDSGYIDANWSVVAFENNKAIGFLLLSLKNDRARIASMGLLPNFRSGGRGRFILNEIISKLRSERFISLELEVFEQNTSALHLYQSMGFKPIRRLFGFSKVLADEVQSKIPKSCSIDFTAKLSEEFDDLCLPWQVSGWRIRQCEGKCLAWQIDENATFTIRTPVKNQIILQSLIVAPHERLKNFARASIQFLGARYPEHSLVIPTLCPQESANFFKKLDFEQHKLNQIQMSMFI